MQSPDQKPARRPRDPRIDAFRGLALVTIFVNHVPGNPYEALTIRNFGFSDAAEAFFIMSGVAAGIAYGGRFQPERVAKDGYWPAISPMWNRAWTLYLTQLFLTLWAIAIYCAGAQFFAVPDLLETINLRQLFANTQATLIGIPALTHQLGYVNILPAYCVLLLAAPLAIAIGVRKPLWLLAGSVALWFAAGVWRLNLPNYPNPGGWFFNPIAWQLIFVVGLLTGIALRRGERFVPRSNGLFALCAGFLLFVLAWRYVPGFGAFLNSQMARLGGLGVPFNIVSHDKTFLAAPRLLHVLALAYVLSCMPSVLRASGSAFAAPLRLLGRQGLLVFSAGTILSLLSNVAMEASREATVLQLTLPIIGVVIMLIVAGLAETLGRRKAAPSYASTPDTTVGTGGIVARAG
ncbi:hypothetical protein SAMN05421688_0571 [Poseidonocella pacifica]|uniref:OpgC protein n=1 Tax=Poseidonocella pacifica TaxID=871651 RepID=A0A1I0VF18_9RHOB|nr:OpgC domain-containing protein [Poseidonocella pacifica]SFA74828.1 hypothetical protein SAMN05421688_0571 [Poseidonocella pacifica]